MPAARHDRRETPANGRVAALSLKGLIPADRHVEGDAAQIAWPVADLRRDPGGARDRQLLLGSAVTVFERREGWAFLQAADSYVGYVAEAALAAPQVPTHRVSSRASHVYTRPDFKSPDRMALPLGARLTVIGQAGRFVETPQGFVPACHVHPLSEPEPDPVAVADRLLGTPYLWGGNASFGIDCSGLVQIALHQCGHPCPGDSDQQAARLGAPLLPGTAPERGDLLFWKGHVAWVADPETLIHANAHHMAVAREGLDAAIARIARQGDGPVTHHLRPLAGNPRGTVSPPGG